MRKVTLTVMALGLVALAASARGQDKSNMYSREAAEKSFRSLVAAKDKDMMGIVNADGLVCFADSLPVNKHDRFLTIVLAKPTGTNWLADNSQAPAYLDDNGNPITPSIYDPKTDAPAISYANLDFLEWVNQDSEPIMYSALRGQPGWRSYGHYERRGDKLFWKSRGNDAPVFRFGLEKDELTGATNISAMEDDTNFSASKTYKNAAKGTTEYEVSVRLSTGRYTEKWTPSEGDELKSVGDCYNAKTLVGVHKSPKRGAKIDAP